MPDLATFTILVDDTAISGELQVTSVVVQRQINRIPSARLIIVDGDAAQATFAVSSSDTFAPGKLLTIKAGYSSDEVQIFKGMIVKHGIKVRRDNRSTLQIEARDLFFKTTLNKQNRHFEEMTDSEIFSEILGGYSLTAEVTDTAVTHQAMVQHQASDWDFILARSRANGLLLLVTDGEVKIAPPDFGQSPAATYTFGADLLSLDLEMDARTQLAGVTTRSWLEADQAATETEAAEPTAAEQGNMSGTDLAEASGAEAKVIYNGGASAEEELQAWADGDLLASRAGRIRGRAAITGTSDVALGGLAELAGVGERFNGKALVAGIRHEISDGQWQTDLEFGLPVELFDPAGSPANPLLPPICDLHIGVVLQLQDDPLGAGRILVNLPLVHPEGAGVWARLATLDAGNNRGTVFRPEINDEVVVGFLGSDPRSPVVLGGLHGSTNAPPIEPSDDNHIKGYVSRSEMKITFDDDKKIMTLSTPAGNSMVLDEDQQAISIIDQNGNSIVMNSDGITMTSPAAISTKSDADTTMEAGGNIGLTATGDLIMDGTNVTSTATAQLSASGSAGAELSSGGQTVVSGSMVAIN